MKKDLETLLQEFLNIHQDFRLISVDTIIVNEWVSWKCKYGCKAYGRHLGCPPYSAKPDETRKLLQEYEKAIITKFDVKPNPKVPYYKTHHLLWDSIIMIHDTMFELEKHAFLSGYYKAFAMNALPCSYCDECIPEKEKMLDENPKRRCKHKNKTRPSMEACGIDVFETVRRTGYEIEVITSPSQKFALYGLLLLE